MYVVFVKNSFTLLGREYFGTDGESIIGYHDPNKAAHFPSKKKAQEFCETFSFENKKIEPLSKHKKLFDTCTYVYRKICKIDNSINIKYNPAIHTADDILDWQLRRQKLPEQSVTFEVYRTWPELYQHFKHIFKPQSYHSKDHKELYHTVTIYTKPDGVYEEFYNEFRKVWDFCTFLSEGGRKMFPIFDNDLSEYGTRYLHYGGDMDCVIISGYGGVDFEGSLEECFNFMKKAYYYGD